MSLTKQTAVSSFSHIFSMSSMLLLQVIIARAFGPEGRGVFASAFAITGFLVLTLGTGHGVSNAYFVASGKQTLSEAAGSSLLGLVASLLLISVAVGYIMYFRPSFASLVSNRILFLGLLAIPFNLMALFLSGILRGIGKAGHSYWYYGIVNSTWLVTVVVFFFLFSIKSIEMLFISKIVAEIIAVVAMLYFLRSYIDYSWLKPQFDKFCESVTYGLRFYFTLIVNPMAVRIEVIIIPMFLLDKAALGLYSQAFAVLSQIMVVSNVVGYVLMPQVAKFAKDSVGLITQACRLVLMVTIVLGIMLMAASEYLVPLIFGKDFSPIMPLMWVMFPGIVLQSICKVLYHYFQGVNKPMTVSAVFFISLVVMVAIDIVSVPRIGIKGAAVGTLVSCLLQTTMFSFAFIRESKIHWYELFIPNSSDIQYLFSKFLKIFNKTRN